MPFLPSTTNSASEDKCLWCKENSQCLLNLFSKINFSSTICPSGFLSNPWKRMELVPRLVQRLCHGWHHSGVSFWSSLNRQDRLATKKVRQDGKGFQLIILRPVSPSSLPSKSVFPLILSLSLSPSLSSHLLSHMQFHPFSWITSLCFYLVSKISGVFTLLTSTKDIMYCHLPLLLFVCFKYCTMKHSIFEMTTIFSKKNLFSFHMVWINREAVCFLPQGHGPFKEAGMVQVIRETPYVLL